MMSPDPEDVALLHKEISGRHKFPQACAKALQRMKQADTNTTGRIFLDHGGVPAWGAYMLTKRRAECQSHVSGKGERQRLLARLERLPVEARQAAAVQLAAAIEPDKARIEHLIQTACENAKRAPRRRRGQAEEAHESADSDSGLQDLQECRDTPTPPRLPSPLPSSNEPLHQVARSQHENISRQPMSQPPRQDDLPLSSDDQHIFVNASIAACNRLFPGYFARSIKRNTKPNSASVAAISMTFPADDNWKAFLSIKVMPNKVEYIAWELFGVRLENEAGFRYACIGAAQVVPTPSLGLQCCRVGVIPLLFGEELANAIRANPVYQQERLREDDCTTCVGMVVPVAADECAKICVSLHLREGTKLKEMMFPSV